MANLSTASATSALNEDAYINKLYDSTLGKQKQQLDDNYTAAGSALDAEQQSVQTQTNTNLGRINVEAQKAQEGYQQYTGPKLSAAAGQQAALTTENQQRRNQTVIRTAQDEADAEIARQRSLLAEQYSTAIKKAQADNDMERAQQLYAAAKAEDDQLLALRTEAGNLMAKKGDLSILKSLLEPGSITRDTESETWDDVLKYEDQINKIYDASLESQRQAAQSQLNESLSKIEADQAKARAETDKKLTQTYVDALKSAKGMDERNTAYGLSSGAAASSRLSRSMGTTGTLADLRGVQMGTDAAYGQQRYGAGQTYRDALYNALRDTETGRNKELYDAAEGEEQNLIDTQKTVGTALANKGDYSVLGKLYGLTDAQIAALKPSGGGGGGGGGYGGSYSSRSGSLPKDTLESILKLGQGPISPENLANQVMIGAVTMTQSQTTGNPIFTSNAPDTSKFLGASINYGKYTTSSTKKKSGGGGR